MLADSSQVRSHARPCAAVRIRLDRCRGGEDWDACCLQGSQDRCFGCCRWPQGTVRADRNSCTSLRKADKITSADQLVLEDDPNFLPELDLLQMDLGDATMLTGLDSLQSPATITPDNSQRQDAFLPDLVGGLMEPASASSLVGGPVGAGYAYSVRGDSGAGTRIGSGFFQQDEPQGLLEDDLGMHIDADDNFVLDEDLPAVDTRQPRAPSDRVDRTDIPSDLASARVRAEHAGGQNVADLVSAIPLLVPRYFFSADT
jgi:hypothetical protein